MSKTPQQVLSDINFETSYLGYGNLWSLVNSNCNYKQLCSYQFVKYTGNKHSKKNPQQRVAIFSDNDFLGSGTFGNVYQDNVFKLNQDTNELEAKEKKKVVKVINTKKLSKYKSSIHLKVNTEYRLVKKTPHIGMKKPVTTKAAKGKGGASIFSK